MNRQTPCLGRRLWPGGIIAFFICFISLSVGFVYYSTRHAVDLVSEDYYDQELRYQEQMERLGRTRAVATPLQVVYDPARQRLTILLPPEHASRNPTGQIHLYRPSAAKLDRYVNLEVDPTGGQTLDTGSLAAGLWRVRVSWVVDQAEYYSDQSVVIPERSS